MCLLIFYHCLLFPVILYCYISRTFNLHLFMQMAAKYSRSPRSQISHIWQEWIYKANNWIVKVNDSLRWMIALCNCYTNAVLELICFTNINYRLENLNRYCLWRLNQFPRYTNITKIKTIAVHPSLETCVNETKILGQNVGWKKQNRLETTRWVFQVNGVGWRKGKVDNG